ncbi:MAG: STAS-like domain-containing protein [Bacteroidota bacterium]|jgi:hypothetical protein
MLIINIAKDFSPTPGARFRTDGPYSGQEFRETFLEQLFSNPSKTEKIQIILDGSEGYATSFLEEAFGGLARKYGKDVCIKRFEFVSNEEAGLIDEIREYIEDVEK